MNINNFDNEQLEIINTYIDSPIYEKLYKSINQYFSSEQIEIIGKALTLNIDITNILNPRLSKESMIILCDAKLKGIDIKGLDNPNISPEQLKQIIEIKTISNIDMTFIKKLSIKQCEEFIEKYKESIKNKIQFNIEKFLETIKLERNKKIAEIEYSIRMKSL